jgi:hypothetical protein
VGRGRCFECEVWCEVCDGRCQWCVDVWRCDVCRCVVDVWWCVGRCVERWLVCRCLLLAWLECFLLARVGSCLCLLECVGCGRCFVAVAWPCFVDVA